MICLFEMIFFTKRKMFLKDNGDTTECNAWV